MNTDINVDQDIFINQLFVKFEWFKIYIFKKAFFVCIRLFFICTMFDKYSCFWHVDADAVYQHILLDSITRQVAA